MFQNCERGFLSNGPRFAPKTWHVTIWRFGRHTAEAQQMRNTAHCIRVRLVVVQNEGVAIDDVRGDAAAID